MSAAEATPSLKGEFNERPFDGLRDVDAELRRVIATGGGSVIDPRNRWLLYRGRFPVWLDGAPEVLASVVLGAALYYGLGAFGLLVHPVPAAVTPLLPGRHGQHDFQATEEGRGPDAHVRQR